jgi:hypothetical protein
MRHAAQPNQPVGKKPFPLIAKIMANAGWQALP